MFAYVRARGHSAADAEDLTQAFFAHFLQKRIYRAADRERGRFRCFLLTALKNYLAHEWEKSRTAKRGGGVSFLSWEELAQESRVVVDSSPAVSPETAFDRRWILKVFEQAGAQLHRQFDSPERIRQFDRLKQYLSDEPADGDYPRIAAEFDLTPNAVAAAVRRLRQKFAELVREQVAQTVSHPQDVPTELSHLLDTLNG